MRASLLRSITISITVSQDARELRRNLHASKEDQFGLLESKTDDMEVHGLPQGLDRKKRLRDTDDTLDTDGDLAIPTTATASSIATGTSLSLTEESVRAYFMSLGGRITIGSLKEAFKSCVSAYNKAYKKNDPNGKAGAALLIEIVKKITVTVQDPVQGHVLALKDYQP